MWDPEDEVFSLFGNNVPFSKMAPKWKVPTVEELRETLNKFYEDDRKGTTVTELLNRICEIEFKGQEFYVVSFRVF